MLQRILTTLRQYNMPLSLDMLSQQLDIEPAALDGMLQTLVQKGRIIELDSNQLGQRCQSCPLHDACVPDCTWYILAEKK
jgi:DNA-binding IclR family transcriptional regulator